MPLPSTSLNNLPTTEWRLAVAGPVREALLTGSEDFFYVWATSQPVVGSIGGHFVKARVNEPLVVPEGTQIWVRSASAPCSLTITIEPTA